ncbi:MAG TPA: cell division topological specificity factor MinE [Candidatus Mediterraneibacter colneyensis]|nr:cell division topological specificity factor MinE [Candidatus Mediterraneibacter colneyensis]
MSVQSVYVAKERLKNLLVSDRIQCTPDAVERLTKDLYQTVSKYMEIEQEKISIEITRNDIHIKYMGENN